MSRSLPSAFAIAIASPSAQLFALLDVAFASGTEYLALVDFPVTYAGHTYTPALGLMTVEPLEETASSIAGLRITIAAASGANIALALAEPVQGRQVTLRLCAIAADGTVTADDNAWQGLMDTLALDDQPSNPTITLTAEHMLTRWDRARPQRYTDAAQQALYPGDKGLEYVAATAEAQIVWPSAEFFKV